MYIPVINKRFERVIQRSFVELLSFRGYERKNDQFYLKIGRVGKLITIRRDTEPTHHGQVVIFTIHVQIISDDVWELTYTTYPDQVPSIFSFQEYPYSTFHRNLGQFYGKKWGDQ